MELIESIGGKLYSIRPMTSLEICPYCQRVKKKTKNTQAQGFSDVAFRRHIFSCFEKGLKKAGFKETVYDSDMNRFPIIPITKENEI